MKIEKQFREGLISEKSLKVPVSRDRDRKRKQPDQIVPIKAAGVGSSGRVAGNWDSVTRGAGFEFYIFLFC